MKQKLLIAVAASVSLTTMAGDGVAFAQKAGGILRTYDPDSPGGLSIQEEATVFARGPMMGVFNSLIMFDQHVPQNSLASIVPDLATDWLWDEEGTALTFKLRQGVKFHDAAVLLIVHGDLHRRRARCRRHYPMVSKGHAQGLCRRSYRQRERSERSGPAVLREFRL